MPEPQVDRYRDEKGKKKPYWGTKVDVDKSKNQISVLLRQYGVSQVRWTEDLETEKVMLEFFSKGADRNYLIRLVPKPFYEEHNLWDQKKGKTSPTVVPNWARAYRMLYTYVKGKLESIRFGMHTIEEEFMPDIVVQDPTTGEELSLADAILKNRVSLPQLDFKG